MEIYSCTDKGKVRENNEDSYFIPNKELGINVFVLSDGMGGYNGGEIASKTAIEGTSKYIINNYDITFNEKNDILALVRGAIEYANMLVYEKASQNPDISNMGATIDVSLIIKDDIYIGHAGDSRIYRVRNNTIRKLTKDDSFVQKLIDDGKITKEDSLVHPDKNMITKAIGMSKLVEPTTKIHKFIKGDILLMCSDGLTNMVKEEEIKEILLDKRIVNPAEELVRKANLNGGKDNITVIVIYK